MNLKCTGGRIRELRLKNKLTLDDVARVLNVGKQSVYKYEQGIVTNIPMENIEKMAALFGTTPAYLAGWTDDEYIHVPDDAEQLASALCRLDPGQRTQAINVIKAMFLTTNPNLFDKESN